MFLLSSIYVALTLFQEVLWHVSKLNFLQVYLLFNLLWSVLILPFMSIGKCINKGHRLILF